MTGNRGKKRYLQSFKMKLEGSLRFYNASFEGVFKVGIEVFADFLKVFSRVKWRLAYL